MKGPPAAYTVWRVKNKLFDEEMNLLDEFEDTQEVWIGPPNIAVRRTRELPDGRKVTYEDRGQVNQKFQISGRTGYGGKWGGQIFMDGWIYTHGSEGTASFNMVNTRLGEDSSAHEQGCCLRIIDVREPTALLTPEKLQPGRYYLVTEENVTSASSEVPDSIKQPAS